MSPPKLSKSHDVSHDLFNDPAFAAILDLERYAKDLPDWDYGTLSQKLVEAMGDGAAIAWGTPEDNLKVRLTMNPLPAKLRARVDTVAQGRITTAGKLCLADYTSLTMCAQFSEYCFPQPGDLAFRVAPGTYNVAIHRMFAHRKGRQFAEGQLPEGDHYVILFTETEPPKPGPRPKAIPWALAAS